MENKEKPEENKVNINEPPKLHELIVTECPTCHKGIGLIGKITREEQLLGHIPQGVESQMQVIMLALDFRNAIAFPVAMIAMDTCNQCGAVFATRQTVYKMTANQLGDLMSAIAPQQKKPGLVRR